MVHYETRVHIDDLNLDPAVTDNPDLDPVGQPTTITATYESIKVTYDITYDADGNVTDFTRTVSDA